MTGHPEAVLARELAMCYTPLALVTDLDAGVEEGKGVTQAEVFEVFAANIKRLRDLVTRSSPPSPRTAKTTCARTPWTASPSPSLPPSALPLGLPNPSVHP